MKYKYSARALNGRETTGEIEAANEQEARVKVRAQRLILLKLVPKEPAKQKAGGGFVLFAPSVKAKDLQLMTRQLATLVSSGVPIVQAMDVLARGTRIPVLNVALSGVVNQISEGRRLGEAMQDFPSVFDRFYCNMVRAGEESGNLDAILDRLAVYIEKSVKIKGKVKGALVYPGAIVTVAVLVVSALLIFVIPKFQSLFTQGGRELPAVTQLVVKLSDLFINYWYVGLGGIIATVVLLMNYYKTDEGRKVIDAILVDTPLIGDLIQKGAIARFSRTLSTLLQSGVGIMEAIDIGAKVVDNHVLEMVLLRAKDAITEGKSLTVPLVKEKYIPSMVTQMIGVGEQTGALDKMLGKIADFYEDEVDVAVGALTSVLEPMLMVVLGAIIAFLVVAMYLPIFDLAGATGG